MTRRVQVRIHAPQARAAQVQARTYARARYRTNGRNLYDTAAWRALRAKKLSENPICECGAPSRVVDHIRPHRGRNDLFFDESNLQTMCKRCHDRKTVKRDGGFGNDVVDPATLDGYGFGV